MWKQGGRVVQGKQGNSERETCALSTQVRPNITELIYYLRCDETGLEAGSLRRQMCPNDRFIALSMTFTHQGAVVPLPSPTGPTAQSRLLVLWATPASAETQEELTLWQEVRSLLLNTCALFRKSPLEKQHRARHTPAPCSLAKVNRPKHFHYRVGCCGP